MDQSDNLAVIERIHQGIEKWSSQQGRCIDQGIRPQEPGVAYIFAAPILVLFITQKRLRGDVTSFFGVLPAKSAARGGGVALFSVLLPGRGFRVRSANVAVGLSFPALQ